MEPTNIVIAFLIKDASVFMGIREKEPFAGFWEFPGGKVENQETQQQAILREVYEECGLELWNVRKSIAIDVTSNQQVLHIQSFYGDLKTFEVHSNIYQTWDWIPIDNALKRLNHLNANEPLIDHLLKDFFMEA